MRFFLFLTILISFKLSATVCEQSHLNRIAIEGTFLSYFSNHQLELEHNEVDQVIISLHGTLRNGEEYFHDMCLAIGNKSQTTLVIAPTFKRVDDAREEGEIYWGRKWYEKWKYGYGSQNGEISSFQAMDELIKNIAENKNFSNIRKISLIGHSAGGQFIQRYSVATEISSIVPDKEIELIVSNPSSYLYLHPQRVNFIKNDFHSFLPSTNKCEEYDDYIYGVRSGVPSYFRGLRREELQNNFEKNPVVYLMAEEDKDTDYLDRSCEANTQGENRIDRAYNFFQYVRTFFKFHQHRFISIPSIGHDHLAVFSSREAQDLFFGDKKEDNFIQNKVGKIGTKNPPIEPSFILMGGGGNDSEAFSYFLEQAKGGDVVVLSTKSKINHRYTHYLWKLAQEKNIPITSITTISTKNKKAASNINLVNKIKNAEAIFLTGGDQYRYFSYWENTPLLKTLQNKIDQGIVLAGSSAGLAILGEFYFSAKNGTIYSEEALLNPFSEKIDIKKNLITHPLMQNIVTDSHFWERNREGRLLSFMHFIEKSFYSSPIGIGVDEKTSLIVRNDSVIKTGKGSIYIYRRAPKSLHYVDIKRDQLIDNKTYPVIENINENSLYISVIDGEIK